MSEVLLAQRLLGNRMVNISIDTAQRVVHTVRTFIRKAPAMLYEAYDNSLHRLSDDEANAVQGILRRCNKRYYELSGKTEYYLNGELIFVYIDEDDDDHYWGEF